jgi:hypothetical protein
MPAAFNDGFETSKSKQRKLTQTVEELERYVNDYHDKRCFVAAVIHGLSTASSGYEELSLGDEIQKEHGKSHLADTADHVCDDEFRKAVIRGGSRFPLSMQEKYTMSGDDQHGWMFGCRIVPDNATSDDTLLLDRDHPQAVKIEMVCDHGSLGATGLVRVPCSQSDPLCRVSFESIAELKTGSTYLALQTSEHDADQKEYELTNEGIKMGKFTILQSDIDID